MSHGLILGWAFGSLRYDGILLKIFFFMKTGDAGWTTLKLRKKVLTVDILYRSFNIGLFDTFWANFGTIKTILSQILENCPTIVKVANQI